MPEYPFRSRVGDYSRYQDVYESSSQKYLHKNAFDEGYVLPDSINRLIGFGSYAPFRAIKDIAGTKDIAMAIGFAKINSDIHLSLSTPYGTRFMNPDFGSKLYTLLFEPYDDFLIEQIKFYALEAVERDVRKVKVKVLNVDTSEREYYLLKLVLNYQVANTHVAGVYVYPFTLSGEPIKR